MNEQKIATNSTEMRYFAIFCRNMFLTLTSFTVFVVSIFGKFLVNSLYGPFDA